MRTVVVSLFLLLGLASPVWAFPDNGVLDTFTGCVDNATPPNSNWTNAVFVGASSGTVDCEDLAVTSTTTGLEGDAYWNPTIFNADCEAYATIVDTASTTAGTVECRLVNIGAGTTDGYMVVWFDGTSLLELYRIDNAVGTLLNSTTQAIGIGDKFGIRTVGNQICSWFNDASAGTGWLPIACVTDATYSAGGRIGLTVVGNTAIGAMDDFGGGNVASVATRHIDSTGWFQ